jgi:hypothetical protein
MRLGKWLLVLLAAIEQLLRRPVGEAVTLEFDVVVGSESRRRVRQMILTATQQVVMTIKPVDAKGNPAPIEAVPEWASSNPEVLVVEPAEGAMTAIAVAVSVGTAQVTVTAKAVDLNKDGIAADLLGVLDIEVVGGEAVAMQITAGTPVEQPAPAPAG